MTEGGVNKLLMHRVYQHMPTAYCLFQNWNKCSGENGGSRLWWTQEQSVMSFLPCGTLTGERETALIGNEMVGWWGWVVTESDDGLGIVTPSFTSCREG